MVGKRPVKGLGFGLNLLVRLFLHRVALLPGELVPEVFTDAQVSNEGKPVSALHDMIALDVLLHHVDLCVQGLNDEQLEMEFLEQIKEELGKLVIRLAEHLVHSIETKSTVTGSIERASRRSKGTGSHSRSAAPARSSATVATACVASTASGKSKSCRENTALFASESDTLLVA